MIDSTTPEVPKEKSLKKKRFNFDLGVSGFWISLGSVILSIVLYIIDQGKDYKVRQQSFHPNLEVIRTKTQHNLKLPANIKQEMLKAMASNHNSVFDIEGIKLDLDVTFTLKNVGSAKATLLYSLYRDTASGEQVLDHFVLNHTIGQEYEKLPQPFFSKRDINIGDSIELKEVFPINNKIMGDTIAIHAFFIYMNEMNQWYNSYYIGVYKFNGMDMISEYDTIRNEPYFKYARKDFNNAVMMIDSNCTSYSYTRKERNRVKELIKEISDK